MLKYIKRWKNELDEGRLGCWIKQTKKSKRQQLKKLRRELEASGFHESEKLIKKLMKQTCLQSVFKRKLKITTDSSKLFIK